MIRATTSFSLSLCFSPPPPPPTPFFFYYILSLSLPLCLSFCLFLLSSSSFYMYTSLFDSFFISLCPSPHLWSTFSLYLPLSVSLFLPTLGLFTFWPFLIIDSPFAHFSLCVCIYMCFCLFVLLLKGTRL